MAIKMLSPEQVRSMSLEEKDEWWLRNVYAGNVPQLTIRSALTGMLLGSILSLTNLYIAARTGWLLGVGITSVILAFAGWKILAKIGLGREMTILENNAMQSIATSAGYMSAPLTSSLAAYSMVTHRIVPMHVAFIWMLCLSALGILIAFPMKKRYINDAQLPFPEGMAAGVLMDSLHRTDPQGGMLKAKLLAGGGVVSALVEILRNEKVMRGIAGTRAAIPAYADDLLYRLGLAPKIAGISLADLTIRWNTSLIFVALGGLTGVRTGLSMILGAALNYGILAPVLINKGIIARAPDGSVGYGEIIVWALWGGIACMTTASLYSFFSKPKAIVVAVRSFFAKRATASRDVLAHIELPVRLSLVGVPIVGVILAVLCHLWFDISITLGILAIPLVFVLALIAVNTTAITSMTPTGPIAQLTQLAYGILAPGQIATNVVTAGVSAEVTQHSANLLMDIKPGYMLGANPRQQAVGHMLGAVAGLAVTVPVWYLLFVAGDIGRLGTVELPIPAAVLWKAVSELLMKGLGFLDATARWAVLVGALTGIVFEATRQITKERFPLSAVGFGLAFVLPFADILPIFLGGLLFWIIERRAAGPHMDKPAAEPPLAALPTEAPEAEVPPGAEAPSEATRGKRSWITLVSENRDTICAGIIAGGSLTGIGLQMAEWLFSVDELTSIGPAISALASGLRAMGR
ncbi:MAG: OPT/YSL family transporter [Polyangiaceae bacterium]|nr:OPT/YSL family transporter [Polyangiaceae bacterium]